MRIVLAGEGAIARRHVTALQRIDDIDLRMAGASRRTLWRYYTLPTASSMPV